MLDVISSTYGGLNYVDNGVCNQEVNYESCLAYDGGDCCDPRSANDRIRQGDQIGLYIGIFQYRYRYIIS